MGKIRLFLLIGAVLLLACGCGRNGEEIGTSVSEDTAASFEDNQQKENLIADEKEKLSVTEALAAELEKTIQTDASLTQSELNEKSYELYMHWDSSLNSIWGVLKKVLDEETMQALTKEELEWIAWKEETVAEAGAQYQGGSIQPLVMNLKAAELTKERVYELLELLD